MLVLHKDSNIDYRLNDTQVEYILSLFKEDFLETLTQVINLPHELGTVLCPLYGPRMGDYAVPNKQTLMRQLPHRKWKSRCVIRPEREVSIVTITVGPHDGQFVLKAAYPGPITPLEPDNPNCEDKKESLMFWADHALAYCALVKTETLKIIKDKLTAS